MVTILRSFFMYRPLSAFLTLGLVMTAIGMVPILRFVWFYAVGEGEGHVQSLVIGSLFVSVGYITAVIAFLSDALATNRRLTEECLERLRTIDADRRKTPR